MNPITGITTDPTPFIIMAYSLGTLALIGYAHWCLAQRRRLRQLVAAVQPARAVAPASTTVRH